MNNNLKTKQNKENIIPIFFAADDNYAPYLGVTLQSMLANASKDYFYKIYVLNTKLTDLNYKRLEKFNCENASIEFVNVKRKLDKITTKLHLRDYYSKATYYRFFISSLFPQYNKALYLDCDIIVLGDISQLYNNELGNNYAGAIHEEVMAEVKVFGDYVEQALGIECGKYFNAGILLMNLEQFRKQDIENKFVDLLGKYKFAVTQDQDYLNVICKGNMAYFDLGWNKTPIPGVAFDESSLKIIHYKIAWKPWHYDDILYGNYFWDYAKQTEYYEDILAIKAAFSQSDKDTDTLAYNNLVQLAITDTNNPNNYRASIERIAKAKSDSIMAQILNKQRDFFNDTITVQVAGLEKN